MTIKINQIQIGRSLTVFFGMVLLLGLTSCGGSSPGTVTDYNSVDATKPVDDWVVVWEDNFDGTTIDSNKWTHEVNCDGGGNFEQQCYTADAANSFVEDGILNIVALPAADGAEKPYTSARLNTRYKGDFKYGRMEVRAKLPSGQGTHPAFWMLPTDYVYGEWPRSGEIDIVESVNLKAADQNGNPEASISGTLYYGGNFNPVTQQFANSGKEYDQSATVNPADGFHTYAIEWNEGEIRWYMDGYLYQTQRQSKVRVRSSGAVAGLIHRGWYSEYFDKITGELTTYWDASPFDQDFHLLLNLAVGGNWAENVNETGVDPEAFADGATYAIDYVRVYECSIDPSTGKGCETVRGGYDSVDDALVTGKAPIPKPPSTGIAVDLTIFDDGENPDWPLWDSSEETTPVVVEDGANGAVAQFNGSDVPSVYGFNTFLSDDPQGFDAEPMESTGIVTFDLKVVSAPADSGAGWNFKIESGGATGAFNAVLATPLIGEWQTYTFSLQEIADAGVDTSNIDVLMVFPDWASANGAVWNIDNVKIINVGGGGGGSSPSVTIFDDGDNADWVAWACCGGPAPTVETDDAAHGATTQFTVDGTPAVFGFNTRSGDGGGDTPFDATDILANGVIQFELKVINAPSDAGSVWKFKVESNLAETEQELDLTDSIEGVAPVVGEWQTYSFSLSALDDMGVDISQIDVVMVYPAWATGNGAVYRMDNVKIFDPDASTGGGDGGSTGPALLIYNGDEVLTDWVAWACCGGPTPTEETDDAAHGTTTQFTVGATAAVFGFNTRSGDGGGDTPFDATDILANGVIQFELKVINAPSDAGSVWKFKVESNLAETEQELNLTDSIEGVAPVVGEWQTYSFSLSALDDMGVDITQIDVVMAYPAWATGNGAVYRMDNVIIGNP